MPRLPGLGVARTFAAFVFLAALVAVGVLALGPLMGTPGGVSPSPTDIAGSATPTLPVSPTAATQPATETPSSPPATGPSGDVIAYTNPDGPNPADYPSDAYPFIGQAQSLPTYGVLWIDENQRDVHIALTGDIEGAIEKLKPSIPRGITVYFHIARHTQAELCALRDAMFDDREELMRHGIILTSGGCGNMRNRVVVGMSPLTPEAIAYMEERYPGPIDYEYGGGSALRPYTPPAFEQVRLLAVRDGDDLGLLTCGRRPFPEAALDSPTGAETGTGPEYDALREDLQIYADLYSGLQSHTWLVAEKDEYGATFLARRGDGWLEAPVFAGTDGWVPGTIDDCSPRPYTADDYGPASWWLDPAYPEPPPDATEVHLLVHERACSGASSPAGRLGPAIATYDETSVAIHIGVRPVGGSADCPGNPSLPVTIVLPEPLGDRRLVGDDPARD
ncbi:MAG TPA: hypothetical protein VJK49_08050 [Candidatus Limnocylindrales bacterium]|nr:hypothetical protein [Candidatus Limnocylindrales bacterium]